MCDCNWKVQASYIAAQNTNPITAYLQTLETPENANNTNIIDLSQGALRSAPQEVINSLIQTILEGRHNGYAPSVGYEETRNAILDYLKYSSLKAKDILLSSGTTSCLDIAITALANRGQNILIPKPANPLYKLLANGLGIEVKEYQLTANWEVNLIDLSQKIDTKSALILLNNPHNPSGAVYTENHLKSVIDLASRHRVPLVVDEVYRDLVFPAGNFVSAIDVNTKVPLLICGGLGKSFMVPGWRLGWIVVHDPVGAFDDVRKGLISLSQRIIGCNTVIQGAVSGMLAVNNCQFRDDYMHDVQDNARMLQERLAGNYGIVVNLGESIYTFVGVDLASFPDFDSSEQFCRQLYREQRVLTLPGEAFANGGYFRIALDQKKDKMEIAMNKIEEFCRRHYQPDNN